MGAAPCVLHTVSLYAREFIDSRHLPRPPVPTILSYRVYSLLAYHRRPWCRGYSYTPGRFVKFNDVLRMAYGRVERKYF